MRFDKLPSNYVIEQFQLPFHSPYGAEHGIIHNVETGPTSVYHWKQLIVDEQASTSYEVLLYRNLADECDIYNFHLVMLPITVVNAITFYTT